MMKVVRLTVPTSRLLDPNASEWQRLRSQSFTLEPTPLLSQPSVYVQAAWKERPYGVVSRVSVRAAHNGEAIFFRLRWDDPTEDNAITDTDRFADAAAVLLPMRGDAPLTSMGSPAQPVNAWYWRADLPQPLSVTAQGLGTTVRHREEALQAAAMYRRGWIVVISGPLGAQGANIAPLQPGQAGKAAFGVWQGSNRERAGLKAVTMQWQPLEIEV